MLTESLKQDGRFIASVYAPFSCDCYHLDSVLRRTFEDDDSSSSFETILFSADMYLKHVVCHLQESAHIFLDPCRGL